MKIRILCYGDSNTWGFSPVLNDRFDEDSRWTGVLAQRLGDGYTVIEEGLNGRTTVFDDPLGEGLNGFTYLCPCMMTHNPIDLMVVMLGTNDTKDRYGATPNNIADGLKRLIMKAQVTPAWRTQPKILIVCPTPIAPECINSFVVGEMGMGCVAKSRAILPFFREYAAALGCDFLDAGEYAQMNDVDYMHIDQAGHLALGEAIAARLAEMHF